LTTALGVLVTVLTLKGFGFSANQQCACQRHWEGRCSKTKFDPN